MNGIPEVVCLLQLGLFLRVAGLRHPGAEDFAETLPADVLLQMVIYGLLCWYLLDRKLNLE